MSDLKFPRSTWSTLQRAFYSRTLPSSLSIWISIPPISQESVFNSTFICWVFPCKTFHSRLLASEEVQQLKRELCDLNGQVESFEQTLVPPKVEGDDLAEGPSSCRVEGDPELAAAIREIEATCPDSQGWQLWPKHVLQSYLRSNPIELSDSDGDDDVRVSESAAPVTRLIKTKLTWISMPKGMVLGVSGNCNVLNRN